MGTYCGTRGDSPVRRSHNLGEFLRIEQSDDVEFGWRDDEPMGALELGALW